MLLLSAAEAASARPRWDLFLTAATGPRARSVPSSWLMALTPRRILTRPIRLTPSCRRRRPSIRSDRLPGLRGPPGHRPEDAGAGRLAAGAGADLRNQWCACAAVRQLCLSQLG